MSSLRKRVIRAAYENPNLRAHLLPLLKKAFQFRSSDLQDALDAQQQRSMGVRGGMFQVESFQVSTKPWGYVIQGKISAGLLTFEDSRKFQSMVMDALYQYSQRLPGEVSVKAKLRHRPEMLFVLSGKGV